jgi:LmbE family N-acetylglucosaminyl deacetylase
MSEVKRVLAVGAHPDDVEILCAGTLARYVENGVHVTIATVTDGGKGSYDRPPEEVAEIRRLECIASAAVIGAEWMGLGRVDGELVWNQELHVKMIQMMQKVDADLIITHAPEDYASDHTETAKAVVNASFYAVCPQFCASNTRPTRGVAAIYFMDTVCGVGFQPQEYVDISTTLETKLEMYAKHESQHTYLSEREHVDFFEIMRTSARYRGIQCGVKYAEAFRRYEAWPRLSCRRLLP